MTFVIFLLKLKLFLGKEMCLLPESPGMPVSCISTPVNPGCVTEMFLFCPGCFCFEKELSIKMIDFVGEEMNYGKAGGTRLCGAGPWWIGFVLFQYMVSVCSYFKVRDPALFSSSDLNVRRSESRSVWSAEQHSLCWLV